MKTKWLPETNQFNKMAVICKSIQKKDNETLNGFEYLFPTVTVKILFTTSLC